MLACDSSTLNSQVLCEDKATHGQFASVTSTKGGTKMNERVAYNAESITKNT